MFQYQKYFLSFMLLIGFLIFSILPVVASEKFCEKVDTGTFVNAGKCPSGTAKAAKIFAFGAFKRPCKLPRGTTVSQLKMTTKLISYEQPKLKNANIRGCRGEWQVCTRCELIK